MGNEKEKRDQHRPGFRTSTASPPSIPGDKGRVHSNQWYEIVIEYIQLLCDYWLRFELYQLYKGRLASPKWMNIRKKLWTAFKFQLFCLSAFPHIQTIAPWPRPAIMLAYFVHNICLVSCQSAGVQCLITLILMTMRPAQTPPRTVQTVIYNVECPAAINQRRLI